MSVLSLLEEFVKSGRKFLRVYMYDGVFFDGEFMEIASSPNGKMLKMRTFSSKEVGVFLDNIRTIKYQKI